MRPALLAVAAATVPLAILVTPERAEACSPWANSPHAGDPIPGDVTPPSAVTVSGYQVERYWRRGPADTCPDMAWIRITVAATDDQAPVGYELTLASGEAPWGLSLPPGPVRPDLGGSDLYVYFTPEDYLFSFELDVRAVDLNANYGPTTTFWISDFEPPPSTSGGGCSTGGAHGPGAAVLALGPLLVLAAAGRRRARAPRRSR